MLATDFEIRGSSPLAKLTPSPTNPRKHFPPEDIAALAETVRAHGFLEPLLVRPHAPTDSFVDGKWVRPEGAPVVDYVDGQWINLGHLEIINGERRYRAACSIEGTLKGLQIPVVVRNFSDNEVRIIQLMTFVQRADLSVSEEAGAIRDLIAEGRTVESIAEELAKPLGYIRNLARAGRLPAWALEAIDRGVLARATAEVVAKVPGEQTRLKALRCVLLGMPHPNEWVREFKTEAAWTAAAEAVAAGTEKADVLTYRETTELIRTHFTRELKSAPFDRKSLTLLSGIGEGPGSCDACPKRAGNDPEATAEGVRADICLDPDCYRDKEEAYRDEQERKCEEKKILPADLNVEGFDRPPRGWIKPDEPISGTDLSHEFAGYQGATLNQKLGKDKLPQKYFAWGKGGKLVHLVKLNDAKKALVEAGILKAPAAAAAKAGTKPAATSGGLFPVPAAPTGPDKRDIADAAILTAATRVMNVPAGDALETLRLVTRWNVRLQLQQGDVGATAVAKKFAGGPIGIGEEKAALEAAEAVIAVMTLPELANLSMAMAIADFSLQPNDREGPGKKLFGELLAFAGLDWKKLQKDAETKLRKRGTCLICGCTEANCSGCVLRTGKRCDWTDDTETVCTACEDLAARSIDSLQLSKLVKNLFLAADIQSYYDVLALDSLDGLTAKDIKGVQDLVRALLADELQVKTSHDKPIYIGKLIAGDYIGGTIPAGEVAAAWAKVQAAYVADKWQGAGKEPAAVKTVTLLGTPYVNTGGGGANNSYELAKLYTVDAFKAKFPKRKITLTPTYNDVEREAGNCYFGIRVRERKNEFVIGPAADEIHVTDMDPAKVATPAPKKAKGKKVTA